MADGEKRVIDLQALTTNDLTADHYFLVDDASNSGETKRYSASDYKVNMQITVAALYNELDLSDVSWDSNIQYHNHDIVIYTDYMLYMCKVDDSTRGTWVSNEWQRVTLLELWGDSMMTISTEPMLFDGTPYSKNDIVYRISPNATAPYKMTFYKAKADLPNGISSYVATDWNEFSTITDLIEDCNRQIDKLEDDMSQALALGTSSGSIASFTDGSTLPMKKLEVAIEPVQSGSGEPSPTNVRPFIGWDECNVTVADNVDNPTVENVYTIDLDGTRYGGKLDVVSGVLTVYRAIVTYDGSETWQMSSGTGYYQFNKNQTDALNSVNAICDKFEKISTTERSQKSGLVSYASDKLMRFSLITDFGISTVEQWKTWLASNNIQVVYELATPQTIQLTPTEVKSLLATNNIFADTGDILDATYVRNANITINDLIRRIEALES